MHEHGGAALVLYGREDGVAAYLERKTSQSKRLDQIVF